MEIKQERLAVFREMYLREFGIELSPSETREKAGQVMQYVMFFVPKPKLEELEETI